MAGVLRDRVTVDPAKVTSKRFVLWEPRSTHLVELVRCEVVGRLRERRRRGRQFGLPSRRAVPL